MDNVPDIKSSATAAETVQPSLVYQTRNVSAAASLGLAATWSGIRKQFAFYHDPCPLVKLGGRRDRVLLQRPQRGASKVRNCERRTPPANELRLCLARLRSEMWQLRPHDQNHARGNRTLRD